MRTGSLPLVLSRWLARRARRPVSIPPFNCSLTVFSWSLSIPRDHLSLLHISSCVMSQIEKRVKIRLADFPRKYGEIAARRRRCDDLDRRPIERGPACAGTCMWTCTFEDSHVIDIFWGMICLQIFIIDYSNNWRNAFVISISFFSNKGRLALHSTFFTQFSVYWRTFAFCNSHQWSLFWIIIPYYIYIFFIPVLVKSVCLASGLWVFSGLQISEDTRYRGGATINVHL